MTIENIELANIYRKRDKVLVLDILILKQIEDYFREYNDSIIIE